MGGCVSAPEDHAAKYQYSQPGQQPGFYPPTGQPQQGTQQSSYPPPAYYPPVPGTYAAAAAAGIPPRQPQPVAYAQPAQAAAPYTICKALFFPDPALPCHNARRPGGCKRPNCNFAHKPTSLSQLLDILDSARQTLVICVFTITCDDIANAVIDAHKRGVKVRVITDDDQAKTLGSDAARMQQAGIPVKVDHAHTHMHHKFAIVDGCILVNGSFNWSRQAVLGNNENLVILDIPSLTAEFASYFETLWARFTSL